MKAFNKIFILLFMVLTIAGCKNKASLDDKGVPKTLMMAVFGGEDPRLLKLVYEPIRGYLSEQLHMPVEMVYTTDYTAVIEALKSKKAHMAYLSPFSYIIAKKNADISPIAVLGLNGRPSMYYSNIITRAGSAIHSMADVKAHSKNITICFVDPESASGHLVPRAYLNSIGLNPDTAFKQTIFAGGHLSSVYTVKSGKVDIGCTAKMVLDIMQDKKMIQKGDIRILWTSAAIVSSPVVVNNDLNKDFVKKLQQCYLDMGSKAPHILNDYLKLIQEKNSSIGFMVAQDSMYNGVRKIAGGVKDLKLAN